MLVGREGRLCGGGLPPRTSGPGAGACLLRLCLPRFAVAKGGVHRDGHAATHAVADRARAEGVLCAGLPETVWRAFLQTKVGTFFLRDPFARFSL